MKKILLIFTLLFVTAIGFSQPYKPVLASDTTQWNYLTDYGGADFYYTLVFKAYNDTIINTVSYKKLYINSLYATGTTQNWLFGFVREDTVAGKLWFKPVTDTTNAYFCASVGLTDSEYLNMDLSLDKGDTNSYETVTQVTTLNDRKEIIFSDNSKYIEGIGSDNGFQFYYCTSVSELLCMYQNNVQQYINPLYNSCDVTISKITKLSDSKAIHVWVTSSGVLTVASRQSTVPVTQVAVLDITGRTIINDRFDSQTAEIDVSSLKAVVYLVKVNQTVVRKIVIP